MDTGTLSTGIISKAGSSVQSPARNHVIWGSTRCWRISSLVNSLHTYVPKYCVVISTGRLQNTTLLLYKLSEAHFGWDAILTLHLLINFVDCYMRFIPHIHPAAPLLQTR